MKTLREVKAQEFYTVVDADGPTHFHPLVKSAVRGTKREFEQLVDDFPVSIRDIGVGYADGSYLTLLESLCELADPDILLTFLQSSNVDWTDGTDVYPLDSQKKDLTVLCPKLGKRKGKDKPKCKPQPKFESPTSRFLNRLKRRQDETYLLPHRLRKHVQQRIAKDNDRASVERDSNYSLALETPFVAECLDTLIEKSSNFVLLWNLTYWLEQFYMKSFDTTEADLQYIDAVEVDPDQIAALGEEGKRLFPPGSGSHHVLRRNTGGFSSTTQYYDAALSIDLDEVRKSELQRFQERNSITLRPEDREAEKVECRERIAARTAELQLIHRQLCRDRLATHNPQNCLVVTEDQIRNLQDDDPLHLHLEEFAPPSLLERLVLLKGGFDGMSFIAKGQRAMFYRLNEERVQGGSPSARAQTINVTRKLEAAFVNRIRKSLSVGSLAEMLRDDIVKRIHTSPPECMVFALQTFQTLRHLNHKLLRTTSGWYVSDAPQIMQRDATGSILLAGAKCLTEQAVDKEVTAVKAKGILDESVRVQHAQGTYMPKFQLGQMCLETNITCGVLSYFSQSAPSAKAADGRRLLILDVIKKGNLSRTLINNLELAFNEFSEACAEHALLLDSQEEELRHRADDILKRFPNLRDLPSHNKV